MNKTIENAAVTTTLTYDQINTILDAVVDNINEAISECKQVTVEFSLKNQYMCSNPVESVENDCAFKIMFPGLPEPYEISANTLLSCEGLEEDNFDCYCLTLRFEDITIEIEVED